MGASLGGRSAAGVAHGGPGPGDVVNPDDQAAGGGQVGEVDVDPGVGQRGQEVGDRPGHVLDVGHEHVVLVPDHEAGPAGRLAGPGGVLDQQVDDPLGAELLAGAAEDVDAGVG